MPRYTLTGDLTKDDIADETTELLVRNYSRSSLVVPSSVTILYCFNNQLTELILPSSLTELRLNCSGNIYPREILLIRGKVSLIRKRMAVRKMRKNSFIDAKKMS